MDVPVHVDAASGGFVVPFLHPELKWDFRLPRVVSINVSGHKYGLTYPGIGFVVWRSKEYLPEDLVFRVNYLGGDMPTFTLNFSRAGNQVVGQYYNFLRLGREGYTQVMQRLSQTARWLGEQLHEADHCEVISDGSAIPVVAFRLARGLGYTEFDVSHELRGFGWQVPAYTMPDNATDISVLRIVVREGLSADLARALHDDARTALASLDKLKPSGHYDRPSTSRTSPSTATATRGQIAANGVVVALADVVAFWDNGGRGRYADIPDARRPRRGRGGPGCHRAQRAAAA